MENKRFYQWGLGLSAVLFLFSLLSFLMDSFQLSGIFLVSGFVSLAFSVRGFQFFKGFSYTIWILAAVSLSMLYPQFFLRIGDFELKRTIVPLLQIIMFGMGSQMSLKDFAGVVKMPKGVIIGLVLQYTIMPVVGFGIAKLFNFPPEIAAGILLIGCAPSGLASNVMSYIAKANLALAVTLAAIGTILSPLITPLLMKLLAGQYIEVNFWAMMNEIINIIILPVIAGFVFKLFTSAIIVKKDAILQLVSYFAIIVLKNLLFVASGQIELSESFGIIINNTLLFLILPLALGLVIRKLTSNTLWLEKVLSFVSMFGIALIITVITAAGRDSLLKVGGLLILASLIHNLLGYFFGYNIARLFKMPKRDCRTIAFEVGMQNGGLASGLALQMGKLATVGLAPAIFGPLMNITGSSLATWWRSKPIEDKEIDTEK